MIYCYSAPLNKTGKIRISKYFVSAAHNLSTTPTVCRVDLLHHLLIQEESLMDAYNFSGVL